MCFYDVLSVDGPEKWQAEKQFFEMTGKVFPDALDVIRLWVFFRLVSKVQMFAFLTSL